MEGVLVAHPIRDQKTSFFNLLDNFNIGITLSAVYLLSFFGILLFSFLIKELALRTRQRRPVELSKRITLAMSSFKMKQLSAIGLFVLFVHLFLWQTELFLTNNIKTNKVVRLQSGLNQSQTPKTLFL